MDQRLSEGALRRLFKVKDFLRLAKKLLPKQTYEYYRAGADDEQTKTANRRGYQDYAIWNRVLVDVSKIETRTNILGQDVEFPVLIAPTAYQALAHNDGELAVARAAAKAGTIYTVSTMANFTLEEIQQAADGPKWFQLYVHKDRGVTRSLVQRAEEAGYGALVISVDAPVLGRRIVDERNRFDLPKGLTRPNLIESAPSENDLEGSELTRLFEERQDASLTWRDIEEFKQSTRLPIILKGIIRPSDAELAVKQGVAAIIVSNHGGRQLDGAPATIRALPEVAKVVAGRIPVLFDGGIRWGADILKALALGADAVMIGRPILWGLAVGGEAGVARMLQLMREGLERTMALAGCPDLKSITPDIVRRVGAEG